MEKSNCQSDIQLEKKKYDIVFIGGGPSTISFICYLFQKNKAEKVFTTTNILIIEKGENFGSGCLGKYGINTNTSSEGFPRLICYSEGDSKEKLAKFSLSPSKNIMKSTNNLNNGKGLKHKKVEGEKVLEIDNQKGKLIFRKIPLFVDMFQSSAVQTLLAIGNRPAPLNLVGYFLDCLGNFIVHHVKKNYNKNILLNQTEVKSIKMYNNEEFGISIKRNNIENSQDIVIKSKCVILSTGGKQTIDNHYYNEIVSLKGEEKVFHSDFILTELGHKKIFTELNKNTNKKRKVVIIGGSHSGFSSAWIILNNPSNHNKIKIGTDYLMKKEENCLGCVCYGKVDDKNWEDEYNKTLSEDDLEINILYRDHIKVYYPNEEEAFKENYTFYNSKEACNKYGKVYPFIGIRGDAKELYNKIIRGDEKRIKLINTQTNKEQIAFINEADVVIWACGYITNQIPFFDTRNIPVDFLHDDVGTIEVDKSLHLMNKNKVPFRNLYGIGQGYSTKTPEVINGKKARADSIHIYNTYISSKLYKSLEFFLNKVSIEKMIKLPQNLLPNSIISKRHSENNLDYKFGNTLKQTNFKKSKKNFTSGLNLYSEKIIIEEEKKYSSNNLILPKINTINPRTPLGVAGNVNINLHMNISPKGLLSITNKMKNISTRKYSKMEMQSKKARSVDVNKKPLN